MTPNGTFEVTEEIELAGKNTFELTTLPARYGDCLWLEYGPPDNANRILVDCGTADTWSILKEKIKALPPGQRKFDLLVITHIDADHIGGALPLLQARKTLGIEFSEIWFNGRKHLPDDTLGSKDGDALTKELESEDLIRIWNKSAGFSAVAVENGDVLPEFRLAGMTLTLLSPGIEQLRHLAAVWPQTIREAGLGENEIPAPPIGEMPADTLGELPLMDLASTYTKPDRSAANGSSIAFLVEYDSKSILFAADAFAEILLKSIRRLKAYRSATNLEITLCKLPHHGSKANVTEDLVSELHCRHYLISTNGERFHHPDKIGIARVIMRAECPTLYFNYRSEYSVFWDAADLKQRYRYNVTFLQNSGHKLSLYDIL